MASSQPELSLAENERIVLNAGRIPYERFKVVESTSAPRPPPHLPFPPVLMPGHALSNLFPFPECNHHHV